jgi:hypothetical protein
MDDFTIWKGICKMIRDYSNALHLSYKFMNMAFCFLFIPRSSDDNELLQGYAGPNEIIG